MRKRGALGRLASSPLLRAVLALLALSGLTRADAADSAGGITTSHGYAVFGELKYGPGFAHLDYVNPDAPKGGTYRYAAGSSYDSLNQFSLLGTSPFALFYVYDPLMQRSLDEPASYYGVLAKTITYPQDLAWVEFELRPEARWHDGRPITVEDVLFTLDALGGELIDPRYKRITQVIARAEQTGPNRVRMHLVQPNNPVLPTVVAELRVLPKHYFAGRDLSRPSLEVPVTSGPYRIGKLAPGRYIELERDPDYWGADLPINKGRWNFDIVRHNFYRDMTMQAEAFTAGLVDLRFEGSSTRWAGEDRMPAFAAGEIIRDTLPYSQGVFFNSLSINSRRPFLSDRRVRKAIVLAFDFDWVNRVILHGAHGRTESYFDNSDFEASGLPGEGELALLEPYRESLPEELFTQPLGLPPGGSRANQRANLLEARDLLREAGYEVVDFKLRDPESGEPIELELSSYSTIMAGQAGHFVRNMERLGIKLTFRSYDTAQFRHKHSNYDFDIAAAAPTFPPLITPGFELRGTWSSEAADTPNVRNYPGIREPAIDNALDVIEQATDREEVVDAMRAIDRVARFGYYSIPLHHTYPAPVGQIAITYWDRFGRPDKDPTYNWPTMTADHWWWDPAREEQLTHGTAQ